MTLDWTLQTLLPLVFLASAAVLVPVILYRFHGPELRPLALNLLVSTLLLVLLATLLFAGLYISQGAVLGLRPLAAAVHLLRLGLSSALVWLPVLLLTGLSLGIRSEARLAKLRETQEARE